MAAGAAARYDFFDVYSDGGGGVFYIGPRYVLRCHGGDKSSYIFLSHDFFSSFFSYNFSLNIDRKLDFF